MPLSELTIPSPITQLKFWIPQIGCTPKAQTDYNQSNNQLQILLISTRHEYKAHLSTDSVSNISTTMGNTKELPKDVTVNKTKRSL